MRHLIFIIVMLGFLLSLSAEGILISPVEYRVLEAKEYKLDLTPSPKLGKIFATLSFNVQKDALIDADRYSMFLACCAGIDRLKVNGKNVDFYITTDLSPLHFVPILRHTELIDTEAPVICYSFDPDIFDQEQNSVYMEYHFTMPPWQTRADGTEVAPIGEIPFFYPRNIYTPADLSVTVHTTTYYKMKGPAQISDKGTFRTIRKSFIDAIDEDIDLDLIKVLN